MPKTIGIVGGVGPYAGLDVIKKIYDQTVANCDQDHLPVAMIALPGEIVDRTQFLLGETVVNPGIAVSQVVSQLHSIGATVIGIPCNTLHVSEILDEVVVPKPCQLVHMIDEVCWYIKETYPLAKTVGILSTTGTLKSSVYSRYLDRHDLSEVQVSDRIQSEYVQPAISDTIYGVKSQSNPVTDLARKGLETGARYLSQAGADVIVLGCTEIPLALTESEFNGIPVVDATWVLAGALIRESNA